MSENKKTDQESRLLERTLKSLEVKSQAPVAVLVLLLLFFFAASVTTSIVAGSQNVVMFGKIPVPVYTFAGILSSFSNICIILMVIFCGTAGFITAVAVMMIQIPLILIGITIRHNYTSIPGFFTDALTIIAVVVIFYNKSKLEKYQVKLREQATTDILTGLPNGFTSTELINELVKQNKPFAAASMDINDFKSINDTMGFDMGNKVLVEIASRIKEIANEGLSGTLDFVTRINGDEFSIVIRGYDSVDEIEETLKQYEKAVAEKISIDGYEFFISASFGYAIYPADAGNRDELINFSVAAMKAIKHKSSSEHILRFTSDLKAEDHLQIDTKVRDALKKDNVFFNLQPQYDMSHKLRGFEALARMKDSDGAFISPADFIPAAERIGLIDILDLAVYRKSAAFFGDLVRKTGTDITLSLNASVKHMMKSNFIEEIRNLLSESGIPAGQLEIEITESILIESAEKASSCLNELKDMGIRIAIDDFGTGYSSLSYLNSFPSDILKIDKSFIDKMKLNYTSEKYVEAIISMAHVMDFEVVAEGVEEQEQLETLRSINCDYIQGYIWGKPLPAEEAAALVMS